MANKNYLTSAIARAYNDYYRKNEIPGYPLTCGHMFYTTTAPPTGDDIVFCRSCDNYSRVKGNKKRGNQVPTRHQSNEPRARVECENCKFARTYSTTHIATVRGESHVIRLGHTVNVMPPEPDAKMIKLSPSRNVT